MHFTLLKRTLFIFLFFIQSALAAPFIIKNIRVEGLQRISRSTFLSYLPVQVGSRMTESKSDEVIESLYKTKFFTNIQLRQENHTLVVSVTERPVIAKIRILGNKEISGKKLMKGLAKAGIEPGLVFDQFNLKEVQSAIEQQYIQSGRGNASVRVDTQKVSQNRVNVLIHINEGKVARIQSINFLGNKHFSSYQLRSQFSLSRPNLFTFFTHNDRYSREKLDADLEKLTNFYLDHGYLRFQIDKVDVDSPSGTDKVNITIHLTEAQQYHITGYKVEGKLLGQKADIEKLLTALKKGEIFNRQKVVELNKKIGTHYADQGYAFVKVSIQPKINDTDQTVFLTFHVNPGKHVYIRRISFSGNTKTENIVLRREIQVMESSVYSASKLEESKRRLMNLGYIRDVSVTQKPVPNKPSQLDLHYHVKDISAAKVNFRVGYSRAYGFLYGVKLDDPNFMGSGKQVGIGFENSSYSKNYFFSYNNPYFTPDGISQGFSLFSQTTNPKKANLTSSYTSDAYGGNINFGLPISQYSRLQFGTGFEHLKLKLQDNAATQVKSFVKKYGNTFSISKLSGSWVYQNLDRFIFPTQGVSQVISGELGVSGVRYYKADYTFSIYEPLSHGFIVHGRANLGYGKGLGKFDALPFFLNYYAGGLGSVAGFEPNSLGPLDSNKEPFGGNVLATGSVELILPQFISDNLRMTVFVDGGNVFNNRIKSSNIRYSAGVGFHIYVPLLGEIQLAVAKALNKKPGDDLRVFDFTFGGGI